MKHGNGDVNRNFINIHGGFSAMSDYRGVTQTDSKICTSPKEVGFPMVGSNRFGPDPRDQWHCQESAAEIGWLSLSQCSLFILVGYGPLTTCEHTRTHTHVDFFFEPNCSCMMLCV